MWGAGKEHCGQAAFPTTAPPPSLNTAPHLPRPSGVVRLEEGALESFKVIALSPWDLGFPESSSYLPRNLILGEGGPRDPGILSFPGAHLRAGPVRAGGSD